MNAHASPLVAEAADMSLATVLAALADHGEKTLSIAYGDRMVLPGYHVTEVKAGSFVTLDCGANADAWQETILQVEDIPADEGRQQMTVRKFRRILDQVDRRVRLNGDARLTFEIGRPDEPMRVFDVAAVRVDGDTARLELGPRAAICKPRHRAAQAEVAAVASSCCASTTNATSCC